MYHHPETTSVPVKQDQAVKNREAFDKKSAAAESLWDEIEDEEIEN